MEYLSKPFENRSYLYGMGIGNKIRELREKQGFTQTELGKKIGLSQKAVTSYERETREPGVETIQALAKALGVKVEDLFSGGANGSATKVPRTHRAAKNKRSLVVQELFEKLPPQEQRIVLKQIKLMAQQGR